MQKSSSDPSLNFRDVHHDIYDMPARIYEKVVNSGSLSALRRNNRSVKDATLHKAWQHIQHQLLELKLNDPSYVVQVEAVRSRVLDLIDATLTNDIATREIAILQMEEAHKEPEEGETKTKMDVATSVFNISRFMKTHIPSSTISLADYITYCQQINKEVEKEKLKKDGGR